MSSDILKVGVCGAGIGGLTFAVAMAKYPNVQVDLYEATAQFSAFGAGIGIWPRAWDVLQTIGIAEDLVKYAGMPPTDEMIHTFTFRKSDQPKGLEFYRMFSKGHILTFHRGQLQQILVDHLPPSCKIHFSKRLISYEQTSTGVTLLFKDGSTATCDVLLGADGLKSNCRAILLQELAQLAISQGREDYASSLLESIEPTWTGSIAYRSLVPVERLQQNPATKQLDVPPLPVQFLGKNANLLVYPVAQGKLLNLVIHHTRPELEDTSYEGPWSEEVDESELSQVARFSDWEPEVQGWMKCVVKPTKWAIHATRSLPTFISGRVALLGDAGHCMSPHQGSGAGQAIEDAFVLAELLGHRNTTANTIERTLQIYDEIRRPFATDIAKRSLENARYLSLNYDNFDFNKASPLEVEAKLHEMGDVIVRNWKWTWLTTIHSAVEEAIHRLEE